MTFDQSDEETWPDQQKDKDKDKDTWDTDYISDNWEQQYKHWHCDPWLKSDGDSMFKVSKIMFKKKKGQTCS